jgi:hypothetical protein
MQLMKTFSYTLTLVLVISMLASGCKKKIEGELGTPYSKVTGMTGDWELSKFVQIDLNNPIKEERDLTEFFVQEGSTPFTMSFESADRSFTSAIEIGKNYFGESGTWSFDDDNYPSFLYIDNATQILEFEMGNMVDQYDNELQLDLNRACISGTDVTETVIYRFVFKRK